MADLACLGCGFACEACELCLKLSRGTIKQTQTSQPHFLRFNRGELGTRGAPPYLIHRLVPGEVAMFGRDSIRRQGYAWRGAGERQSGSM